MAKHIYTSDEILAMGIEQVADLGEQCQIEYKMTEGELGWLDFVMGKYSIADCIADALDDDTGIVTIDFMDASRAMDADNANCGKATMLSDNTALQRILFCTYIEGLE